LSKLRAGGRFNPELLENLRVQPDKNNAERVKLSDVAQVVPKGRTVQVIVGEKDVRVPYACLVLRSRRAKERSSRKLVLTNTSQHVKPVSSAIQASTLSLTPQPDPTGTNPLLLVINIPPPTADSRKAAVAEAAKAGDKAGTAIKDARSKQQKKLRGMQLAKTARPDELKKAGTAMEKVVEKGSGEVKKVVDSAKKVLESG
jgi:ribosome recycling factor